MGLRILIIILIISFNLSAQENIISLVNGYMKDKSNYNEILFVSVDEQKLYHIKSNTIFKIYQISSSKLGIGNEEGSNKTPTGLHLVKKKNHCYLPKSSSKISALAQIFLNISCP